MGKLSTALRYLVADPVRHRSFALLLLRLAQLTTERAHGRADAAVCRALRWVRPPRTLPPPVIVPETVVTEAVTSLHQRGWFILPEKLTADDLADIRAFAFSTPAYATHSNEQIALSENHIPSGHGRYFWRMSDLLRLPAVRRLLTDGALHRIAQGYLDCLPVLTSITLWLDPVFDGVYDAHVYHYDIDGPAFLKFFMYITDVDEDTGPHTYIQGSHSHVKPPHLHLARRYERDELLAEYGAENEKVFTAPAGTILAEDTAGFHKGKDIGRGYRLLMQFEYAMLDIPHAEEFERGIERISLPELHPSARRIARKFVI